MRPFFLRESVYLRVVNSGYYFLSAKDVSDGQLQYHSARQITKNDFAALNPDGTSIALGTMLHQVLAVFSLLCARIILWSRNIATQAGS